VERHATVGVALGARHLRAAQTAGHLDLHALRPRAHRRGESALHRATEGHPVLKLLGNRLGHQVRVELGPLDLEDVDLHGLPGHPVELLAERIHLGPGLADHDPRPRRVDVDLDLVLVLLDRDVREPGVRQLVLDVVADVDVLQQIVGELALVEPGRLPVVDVADPEGLGVHFVPHGYLPFLSAVVSSMVMWLVRFRMRVARPRARGR
jgi:hypothetical protein